MIEDQMSSLLAPSESEVVTYAKINFPQLIEIDAILLRDDLIS